MPSFENYRVGGLRSSFVPLEPSLTSPSGSCMDMARMHTVHDHKYVFRDFNRMPPPYLVDSHILYKYVYVEVKSCKLYPSFHENADVSLHLCQVSTIQEYLIWELV